MKLLQDILSANVVDVYVKSTAAELEDQDQNIFRQAEVSEMMSKAKFSLTSFIHERVVKNLKPSYLWKICVT
jgi:hypothetical protein